MAKTAENYEVLKVFRDKETQKRYIVGALYTGEHPERLAELQAAGYLATEPQAPEAAKPAEKKAKAGEVTPDADDAGKS